MTSQSIFLEASSGNAQSMSRATSEDALLPQFAAVEQLPPAPAIVKFTEAWTDTPDMKKAEGIAGMLFMFLVAGATVLGVFAAAIAYLFITVPNIGNTSWMFFLLVSAGTGGLLGCAGMMTLLNARGLIALEGSMNR